MKRRSVIHFLRCYDLTVLSVNRYIIPKIKGYKKKPEGKPQAFFMYNTNNHIIYP